MIFSFGRQNAIPWALIVSVFVLLQMLSPSAIAQVPTHFDSEQINFDGRFEPGDLIFDQYKESGVLFIYPLEIFTGENTIHDPHSGDAIVLARQRPNAQFKPILIELVGRSAATITAQVAPADFRAGEYGAKIRAWDINGSLVASQEKRVTSGDSTKWFELSISSSSANIKETMIELYAPGDRLHLGNAIVLDTLIYEGVFDAPVDSNINVSCEDENPPIIDVTCYGVIPDDEAEDSLALQALFDSLGGDGNVYYFPPGEYFVRNVAIPANSTLRGSLLGTHFGETVLKWRASSEYLADPDQLCRDSSPIFDVRGENVTIENLTFDGSNGLTDSIGGHSESYSTGGSGACNALSSFLDRKQEADPIGPPILRDHCGLIIRAGAAYRAAIRADGRRKEKYSENNENKTVRCDDLDVSGLVIKHNRFRDFYGGILVGYEADDITFTGNRIERVHDRVIHIIARLSEATPFRKPKLKNVQIQRNFITNAGQHQEPNSFGCFQTGNVFTLTGFRDVDVSKNTVLSVDRVLLRFVGWNITVFDNELRHNVTMRFGALDFHHYVKNVHIEKNDFHDIGSGITFNATAGFKNVSILNNYIGGTRDSGIEFSCTPVAASPSAACKNQSSDVLIYNNTIRDIGAADVFATVYADSKCTKTKKALCHGPIKTDAFQRPKCLYPAICRECNAFTNGPAYYARGVVFTSPIDRLSIIRNRILNVGGHSIQFDFAEDMGTAKDNVIRFNVLSNQFVNSIHRGQPMLYVLSGSFSNIQLIDNVINARRDINASGDLIQPCDLSRASITTHELSGNQVAISGQSTVCLLPENQ